MLRYAFILGAFAYMLFLGVSEAEEAKKSGKADTAVVEESAETKDEDKAENKKSGSIGEDEKSYIPPKETFNRNTGMRDVVPSDSVGELN